MFVSIIEEDRYRCVQEWRGNDECGLTLDDSIWSEVRRWFHAGQFVIYCMRHRSESCMCVESVKQYRKDCFLDTDK